VEFDHRCALHKAIKYFDNSQAELARAIRVDRRKINDWFNRDGRAIPYNFAVAIELATNGNVTREELAPHVQFTRNKHTKFDKNICREKLTEASEKKLKISEKVKQGMKLEKQIGKRQGKRTDLKLEDNNQLTSGKKTREFVAQRVGFKSDRHYRRAKKIVFAGCKELVAAIDEKYIALNVGEFLVNLSHQDQRHFLRLPKKEIISKAKKLIQHMKRTQDSCVEKSKKNDVEVEVF
jgi:DNA-binding transcriptional regulator YdaS (Cro superfamily)